MTDFDTALNRRIRVVRERVSVSQEAAATALAVSQPTYSRIEDGTRPLKGAELIQLADAFGVRVGAITGLAQIGQQTRFAARTDGTEADMAALRDHLYAYFELDSYLESQGLATL